MFHTQAQSENYSHGITRSFIDDGRIVLVETEGDMSRNAINTWASLLVLTMQEWPTERPLAILHDLTHPAQGLTPFARERTADVVKARPDGLVVYNAVLLPPTFIKQIIGMFLRIPLLQKDGQYMKVFSDKDKAIAWLREKIS